MNQSSLPDILQIQQLIQRLYKPNTDPETIKITQNVLQQIQKSPYGWRLADQLLQSSSPTYQFFGVLTYTVKLNSISSTKSSSDEDLEPELIQKLLSWLVRFISDSNTAPHVVRKLLSTLSLFFTKYPQKWPRVVKSVLSTVAFRSVIVEPAKDLNVSLQDLDQRKLVICLDFYQILAEDVSNSTEPQQTTWLHTSILTDNCPEISNFLNWTLSDGPRVTEDSHDRSIDIKTRSLSTLNAWISQAVKSKQPDAIDSLRTLIPGLLHTLESPNLEVIEACSDCIVEIYGHSAGYFTKHFEDSLGQFLITNMPPSEDLVDTYVKLLIAFCLRVLQKWPIGLHGSAEFLSLLNLVITFTRNTQGYANVDTLLPSELLEFWQEYAETYADEEQSGSTEHAAQVSQASDFLLTVVEIYLHQIQLPDDEIFSSWTVDDQDAFISFRRDFSDFLETCYPLVGRQLTPILIQSVKAKASEIVGVQQYTPSQYGEIKSLETYIYAITSLTDSIPSSDISIMDVFNSPFLTVMSSNIHPRFRQSTISLIGSYGSFFEHAECQQYLFSCLDFLFKSLGEPSLSLSASKSIQSLCSTNRKYLTQALPSFFETYTSMSLYSVLDTTAHERTIRAIASVIQAVQDPRQEAQYISQLTEILVHQLREYATSDPDKVASLLKCLVCMGKGLQTAEETHSDYSHEHLEELQRFWDADEYGIRSKLVEIIQVFCLSQQPFSGDLEICECCCSIIKSGFSESVPGPFVFDTATVLQFISQKRLQGPLECIAPLTDLACCFLPSHSVGKSVLTAQDVNILIKSFFSMNTSEAQEYEPDVNTGNIKLLTQILDYYFDVFISHPNKVGMVQFALNMLDSTERFCLRAACQFWNRFISIDVDNPRFASRQVKLSDSQSLRQAHDALLFSVGPDFTFVIVKKISGDAARADLDYYNELIKKLVFKYPMESKPWFIHCVVNLPPSYLAKVELKTRQQFVNRIFQLRGARETSKVVREFWLACRGIQDYL